MAFSLEQINGQGNLPIDFNMEIPNAVDQGKILINTRAIEFLMRLTGIGILHIGTYEDEEKPDLRPFEVGEVTTAARSDIDSPDPFRTQAGRLLPGPDRYQACRWVESTITLNTNVSYDRARLENRDSRDPKLWADLIDHGVRQGIFDIAKKNMFDSRNFTLRDFSLGAIQLFSLASTTIPHVFENLSNKESIIEPILYQLGLITLTNLLARKRYNELHEEISLIKKGALNGYRHSFFIGHPQLDRYLLAQIYGRANTLAAVRE